MDVHKQAEHDTESPPIFSPSIESLPFLVLSKIFKLLPSPDRESAMRVCIQWQNIIQFSVGLTLFVGNGLVYNFPRHKSINWRPLNELASMGIEKCVFSEQSADDNEEYSAEKGFMLPELVRELSFYGKISTSLFRVIMTPVYWLTTLKIHLVVFRHITFDDYALRLGCLTHLSLFYTHPVFHLNFPFKEDDPMAKEFIHRSLTKFLNTCFFRRIQIFEFDGPYFVDKTENLIDAVRSFVTRHHITLKVLLLSFPYEWNVPEATRINGMSSAAAISLSQQGHLVGVVKPKRIEWGNLQLRRLRVVCPATIVPPVQVTTTSAVGEQAVSAWSQKLLNDTWRSLLEQQTNVSNIQYINKYEDWPFPQSFIMNNAQFLTVLLLNVNASFPVDCKPLSFCENLRKLNLEGNNFHVQESPGVQIANGEESNNNANEENNNNSRHGETMKNNDNNNECRSPSLFNAHLLPESLQEICLSKVMIPVHEMEALVEAICDSQRFQILRSLQLYQICKGLPQFGLTAGGVQRLFDQSNWSVSFWQALNCTSFEKVISKALDKVVDVEVLTMMKVLEQCDNEEVDEHDRNNGANLRFQTLYDCHVQVIRKGRDLVQTK